MALIRRWISGRCFSNTRGKVLARHVSADDARKPEGGYR
jgi:hypothetical protein